MKSLAPQTASSRCMSRRMRGVGLIELMVSIAIGLLIVGALSSVFLSTARTSRTQDASAQLDDNGRFALESIARVVRLAGYRNWGGPQSNPPGYDGTGDPSIDGADGADADVGFSDTLAIRFHGSGPVAGLTDGTITDCTGVPVAEGATLADRRVNTFTVARVNNALRLMCDPGTGPVALASDIESFQLLYGLDLAGSDRVPDRWASAAQVAGQWEQVVAVRISILMSAAPSTRGPLLDDNTYRLFGPDYTDGSDLGVTIDASSRDADYRARLRKVYSTTVFLRNRTFASEV